MKIWYALHGYNQISTVPFILFIPEEEGDDDDGDSDDDEVPSIASFVHTNVKVN